MSASVGSAQVSVPLPSPAPSSGQPTTVPLPGTPAPTPTPEPATVGSSIPLGPHGRPDINPYNRDIDMTVPITFRARSLGDIAMRLTADDRYLLDADTFV